MSGKRPRRRVYVDLPLEEGGTVPLDGNAQRRLIGSLRLGPGSEVAVFNGEAERCCTIERSGGVYSLRVGPVIESPPPSPLRLTLLQGMAKGEKIDLVVEKGAELGVESFVVFDAARSVARKKDLGAGEGGGKEQRWRRLAIASAEQCGRLRPPQVRRAGSLGEALRIAGAFELRILLDPGPDATPLKELLDGSAGAASVAIIIGPEGGLDESELESAQIAGFAKAAVGPRVMRTETAGLVACALVQYALGDLGGDGTETVEAG